MANTYTLISTLNGGGTTIDFTSIPQTYTDLVVLHYLRFSSASGLQNVFIRFNNDSGTSYKQTMILSTGDGLASYVNNSANAYNWSYAPGSTGTTTANAYSNGSLYIPNYANTTDIKSTSLDLTSIINASTDQAVEIHAGYWNSTSAINRITFTANADTFTSGSTVSLYGISNA